MLLKLLSVVRSKKMSILLVAIIIIMIQAACLTSSAPPSAPAAPVVDETKMALGVAATSNAIQQTEAAKAEEEKQAAAKDDLKNTMDAISVQQTVLAMQNESNANSTQEPIIIVQATAEPDQPTGTPDPLAGMDEKIRNAKVLIFEDTSVLGIGQWIEDTVRRMGIKNYTQTNDYSGDFMEQLNSPTKWDLILVGAESKTKIQGEFWDAIMERVDKKVAVVAEVWYLDLLGGGRIKAFTSECGVGYASNYDLAESIYWWDIESPVFTTPNIVDPLIHYNRYWNAQCGDKMRITGGGDAQMLAGYRLKPDSRGGFIASCMGGRTIIQSFSNHDYHEDQIKDLWENYITYTLTNHFLAMP